MDSTNGEDVNDFLQRIRELGDKRDNEDEERARKLEEDILASREARRARRDERARSLSPQKDSPGGTPISLTSAVSSRPATRDGDDSPAGALETLTGKLADATADSPEPSESPRITPVLSWQRRPKSVISRSSEQLRPFSPGSSAEETTEDRNSSASREQIATRLSSKEPSWFKQTANRNATSGALRKSEDQKLESARMALPGMSPTGANRVKKDVIPEPIPEPQKSMPSVDPSALRGLSAPVDLSRSDSTRSISRLTSSVSNPSFSLHNRSSSIASNSSARFGEASSHEPAMSPSQGRLSPERRERTPSPTKGLGGFVQSAMLKREGSVNKRWSSSQQAGGLSRNNSTASVRSTYGRNNREPAQSNASRESSPVLEEASSNTKSELTDNGSGKPEKESTTNVAKSDSKDTLADAPQMQKEKDVTPPASPTKTFDQKRWSPTKSSWLESALRKGNEGTQPTPPAKPIAKVADRNSKWSPVKVPERIPDTNKTAKPPVANPKPPGLSPRPSATLSEISQPKTDVVPEKLPSPVQNPKPKVAEKPASVIGSSSSSPSRVNSPSVDRPAKPVPGPKEPLNLRAGLKRRPTVDKGNEKEELPFLNAMSRLRATKTQNYKAPDELKKNILDGKSKLNTTGGPQKNNAPDPLKQSIISAKGSLKHSDPASPTSPASPVSAKPTLGQHLRKDSLKLASSAALPSPAQNISKPAAGEQPPTQSKVKPEKKSSLADRFNPALANILQREPPTSGASIGPVKSKTAPAKIESASENSSGSAPLTHITKGRARGPKRRIPTQASSSNPVLETSAPARITPKPIAKTPIPIPTKPKSPLPSKSFEKILSPSENGSSASKFESTAFQTPKKVKPPTPAKSPLLRSDSNSSFKEGTKSPSPTKSVSEESVKVQIPPPIKSPSTAAMARSVSREGLGISSLTTSSVSHDSGTKIMGSESVKREESPLPSVKGTAAMWESPIESPKPSRSPAKVPILTRPEGTAPPSSSIASEPQALPVLPSRSPSPQTRPTNTESESSRLLMEFFKGPFFRAPKADFDILSILSSKPLEGPDPVKSLHIEVSEITGYGKLQRIPQEQEHVFFEENIYLCVHVYEGRSGKKETEVYLWSGLQASESAVEDAQLFARKTARENDGRLVRLQQGRETPSFFQAIGGILITRRGSHEKINSNNPFMLCGRKVFGGVAFDEVDMQTSSLCSAFPYIVFASGAVFLWKGRGATAEELGVARLVGFDISGGEVKEMQEGKESDAFFDALGGDDEYTSADYWHLKPSCRNYGTRLFKVDTQTQSKVIEMSLVQADLSPFEIYVVDAFFEFYIVLGSKAQAKRAEFQLALQFTQEYAILAVSVDDRPFIPISSVILGGAPRDFKALFRTWEDSKTPTNWQPNRKPSLRLLGLHDAIEAVGV